MWRGSSPVKGRWNFLLCGMGCLKIPTEALELQMEFGGKIAQSLLPRDMFGIASFIRTPKVVTKWLDYFLSVPKNSKNLPLKYTYPCLIKKAFPGGANNYLKNNFPPPFLHLAPWLSKQCLETHPWAGLGEFGWLDPKDLDFLCLDQSTHHPPHQKTTSFKNSWAFFSRFFQSFFALFARESTQTKLSAQPPPPHTHTTHTYVHTHTHTHLHTASRERQILTSYFSTK